MPQEQRGEQRSRQFRRGDTFQTDNYARDIAHQEGAWLVTSNGLMQLVNTERGHSIRDTLNLGLMSGVVVQPTIGKQAYTVTKISDNPISLDDYQQQS